MPKKGQSTRLTKQHEKSHGVAGIFGKNAKQHDSAVQQASKKTYSLLQQKYPFLIFRHRHGISKKEINLALQKIDQDFGQTLFVEKSRIKPDGGIIEVQDDCGNWRVVLVSEAKHQGKDIENIQKGKKVGPKKDKIIMAGGNAIERSHKNISEIANLLLSESHFPYVLFLAGSNFLTKNIIVKTPTNQEILLDCKSGSLNRIDRLTSANYGMAINKNLCENKLIAHNNKTIMIQATSIYTQEDGSEWEIDAMCSIMFEIATTSLKILGRELFNQLTASTGINNEKK